MIDRFLRWLTHRHEWLYAGADTVNGKEGYWYWHIEECRWCPKRRGVLDNSGCNCGEGI